MLLALAVPNHRRFLLHLINLVRSDGVKRDVDDQDDGDRCVDVDGFNHPTPLNPAPLDAQQRLVRV